MTNRQQAALAVAALASCDPDAVRSVVAEHVLIYGTDRGERWEDRESLLDALEEMRELGLSADWRPEARAGSNWIAGTVLYRFRDGTRLPARVSLVFEDGKLVHGHFSVAHGE